MDAIPYTPMPDIWNRWVANKIRERRDMQTLAENGIKFFDVDAQAEAVSVDWDTVTVAEVSDGH